MKLKADQRFQITNTAKSTNVEFRTHKREEVPGSTTCFGFGSQINISHKEK